MLPIGTKVLLACATRWLIHGACRSYPRTQAAHRYDQLEHTTASANVLGVDHMRKPT